MAWCDMSYGSVNRLPDYMDNVKSEYSTMIIRHKIILKFTTQQSQVTVMQMMMENEWNNEFVWQTEKKTVQVGVKGMKLLCN